MPPSPPPTHDDIYAQLIDALHPSPPIVLEIEILPSSFSPKILHESPAIGVPKSLLIPLYLQARKTFFDHLSSRDSDSYHAALQSTAIILLFDPNHLTAANFRKRHIERFCGKQTLENGCSVRLAEDLAEAVRHELRFLESLVTSPLSKHAKSSTLWAQRLWVLQNFVQVAVREHAADGTVQMVNTRHRMRGFWDGELATVMKAGERHPRNYYTWQYARQLFSFVRSQPSDLVERKDWNRKVLRDGIALVRGWCLMHPRDISGWAFLVFLLEQMLHEGYDDGNDNEIGYSALETREFVRNYGWTGESIEWFLKAMRTLNIND